MKLGITALLASVAMIWAMMRTEQIALETQRNGAGRRDARARSVTVLEENDSFRLVKHPLGETRVSTRPRRIVSLTSSANDGLAALGIKPVLAVQSMWVRRGSVGYLQEQLAGVPRISHSGGTNLEAIFQAHPDLILAGARDMRSFGQLSKIAPTICLPADASGNRELSLLDVGAGVGKEEQARRRLELLRQRVAVARDALAAAAPGAKVTFLRFRQGTCVIYARSSMFGPLLFDKDQLALQPDPCTPEVMHSGGWDVLSVERLSTLQADHIFALVDPDSETYLEKIAQTAIWRDIPAVRAGHVHRVDPDVWLGGDGVLGTEKIVDDVVAAMAPSGSNHVSQ